MPQSWLEKYLLRRGEQQKKNSSSKAPICRHFPTFLWHEKVSLSLIRHLFSSSAFSLLSNMQSDWHGFKSKAILLTSNLWKGISYLLNYHQLPDCDRHAKSSLTNELISEKSVNSSTGLSKSNRLAVPVKPLSFCRVSPLMMTAMMMTELWLSCQQPPPPPKDSHYCYYHHCRRRRQGVVWRRASTQQMLRLPRRKERRWQSCFSICRLLAFHVIAIRCTVPVHGTRYRAPKSTVHGTFSPPWTYSARHFSYFPGILQVAKLALKFLWHFSLLYQVRVICTKENCWLKSENRYIRPFIMLLMVLKREITKRSKILVSRVFGKIRFGKGKNILANLIVWTTVPTSLELFSIFHSSV